MAQGLAARGVVVAPEWRLGGAWATQRRVHAHAHAHVPCAVCAPVHVASASHRARQVSQLHLPSVPMRAAVENALKTGELASSLVIVPCA